MYLKWGTVIPVFMKGDKSQPRSYRPINLTSVVYNLMKTIIRGNMVKYPEYNKLINHSHHDFLSKYWCLTNSIDFFL